MRPVPAPKSGSSPRDTEIRRLSRASSWSRPPAAALPSPESFRSSLRGEGIDESSSFGDNERGGGVEEAAQRCRSIGGETKMTEKERDDKDDDDGGSAASASASATVMSAADAMLLESRLDALLACDVNILRYDPRSFLIIFRVRGRNMGLVAIPLACLTAWGLLWAFVVHFHPPVGEALAPLEDLIAPLLLPVSFMLVFRLGRAAVRYWDARAAVGKLIETCRTASSTASAACLGGGGGGGAEEAELAESFARWLCVFPIAVKNFVQPVSKPGWEDGSRRNKRRYEVGALLSEEDAMELLDPPKPGYAHGPLLVLNRLRVLARRISSRKGSVGGDAAFRSMVYHQLNQQIDILTGAWGGMERINATPLPFVYVVHLRTFLILYLLFWHLEAVAVNGWVALPALLAGSWGLLGIEAAAVECEQPFKWHSNHLTLGKMCVVVAQNVAQTLSDVEVHSNS